MISQQQLDASIATSLTDDMIDDYTIFVEDVQVTISPVSCAITLCPIDVRTYERDLLVRLATNASRTLFKRDNADSEWPVNIAFFIVENIANANDGFCGVCAWPKFIEHLVN